MKKKIVSILLAVYFVTMPIISSAEFDYSVLDEMTKEELKELRDEITTRLDADDETEMETSTDDSESAWEIDYFVDEFDLPTEDGFLKTNIYDGSFENSATRDEDLDGYFIVTDEEIAVALYEYKWSRVTNIFSHSENYSVLILDQDKNKQKFSGVIFSKGDRIYFYDKSYDDSKTYTNDSVIDVFKRGGEITIKISKDDGIDSYLFKVDCDGFKELYEEFFG